MRVEFDFFDFAFLIFFAKKLFFLTSVRDDNSVCGIGCARSIVERLRMFAIRDRVQIVYIKFNNFTNYTFFLCLNSDSFGVVTLYKVDSFV